LSLGDNRFCNEFNDLNPAAINIPLSAIK